MFNFALYDNLFTLKFALSLFLSLIIFKKYLCTKNKLIQFY